MHSLHQRASTAVTRPPCNHQRLLVPINPARELSVSCAAISVVTERPASPVVRPTIATPTDPVDEINQHIREGHYETSLVHLQANKPDPGQTSIASVLPPPRAQVTVDVTVVGAGPAGLFLASELGKRGLKVNVIGRDLPVTNNYGVWTDEFESLGLMHTVECSWPSAVCYFGEENEVRVQRGYSRVSRRKLRDHLLALCSDAGVNFLNAEVEGVQVEEDGKHTRVTTGSGQTFRSRLVTLAAGAAGGRFLKYEEDAPVVAAQTAYGIEAEVEGYDGAYPKDLMLFMDFRRHHTGLYDGTAQRLQSGKHCNAGDGLWGSSEEAPSFLYAMPLGGNRVFLEETCLVAKPALPFAVLKRRLDRRLRAMGVRVTKVHEEEWSYIPVGGPLPLPDPSLTAFGAAANLVHPATGFSVARSFREAPAMADALAATLNEGLSVSDASTRVWETLWPQEKRTQAAFNVFGMELLATLDLGATNDFFSTFFRLPQYYWRGYLASKLGAGEVIAFALIVFVMAPFSIKYKLMEHLFTDPAGSYLVRGYQALWGGQQEEGETTARSGGIATTSVVLSAAVLTQLLLAAGAATAQQ